MQHENLRKGIFFGLIGNILFMVFGIVCLIYYYSYDKSSIHSTALEFLAYFIELSGFGLLAFADYLLIKSARFRRTMKICFTAYIVIEAIMMILEINAGDISFYAPYSLPLAIVHSIVSAGACFSFLQLDPENKRFEYLIIACVTVILAGMMGKLMGIRVYFSIAMNALGQALLFAGIIYLQNKQLIEIDCYGDRANVREFNSSTLFADSDTDIKLSKSDEESSESSGNSDPEASETDKEEKDVS